MNYENMAVTVSQVNSYIKEKIASDEGLNSLIIKGEISNFKNHYTGHLYFTLKDDKSLIKCIMFKSYAQKLNFMPKYGMKVFVFGEVSVFERDGIYQVYVKAMQEDGVGALYKKYEELKQMLEEQGYFDISHKKKIPQMPKIIGVLTSQTGSVIRDIINVSTRRNPNVQIRLFPVPVQGQDAAPKIAEGIRFMNKNKLADVLILARGGGSLEDLWPFNEEIVAHAIYESELPIISAVGHETDFSISDFVADLRAPTPSAAAELAVPDIYEVKQKILGYKNRLKISLNKKYEMLKLHYEKLTSSFVFKEPLRIINERSILLDNQVKQIENIIKNKKQSEKERYVKLVSKLDTLSPLKTLTRGYSIIEQKGKIINSVKELQEGNEIDIQMIDGKAKAKII
ncbi:MAG: exodeoxyribonuclease VII large subunit [Clostridium sp. 27_14]|nr:MAG: exodeoxyribonuclease VII large subunit [Clostridium sp. 27_14]